jgi:methionyl aminopeptidase
LTHNGFPAAACISVNEEIIHGIPSPKRINEGDIVKIDVGAFIGGYHGDCAATFGAGGVSAEAKALIDATKQSFYEGIKNARVGFRVSDISNAVQRYVEERGYRPVRSFVGHGVGANLHEDPEVPNYGQPGRGPRLEPGMTIAVEPMINVGTHEVNVMPNGWTVVTRDGRLSAHYENTVLITAGAPVILTGED